MKMLNLCVALIFSLSLCLAVAPMDSFAKSSDTKSKVEKATKKTKKATKKTKTATKKTKTASKKTTKPTKKTRKTTKKTAKTATKVVNINSADKKMLAQIPGIGPKTAASILKYRKANGKFKSPKDLMNVKGIGEKTFKKMKPFLKF